MNTNRKIIMIILILFSTIVLIMVILFLYFFLFGKITLFQPNYFELHKVDIVPGSRKTKEVGEKGGTLKLVNRKGTKITLDIPAGALEKEADIILAELASPPVSGQDSDSGPGIFLGPIDIQFKKTALITFDFNPQNEQPARQNPSAQVSASTPSLAVPTDDGLTEAERTRHQNAPEVQINERSGVLYTNSSEDRAGNSVYLAPSTRDQEAGEIESAVSGGGTYSANSEVAKADAKDLAESILENPNATSEQVLEAWSIAQQWGLDDVEQRAKDKMKNRIDGEIKNISDNCENGNSIKVSKKSILQLQGLAQELGMNRQEQKLGELLQSCRAYYSIDIKYYNVDENSNITDDKLSASVCGFVDEEWKANYDEVVSNPLVNGTAWTFHDDILGLHLKPGGGFTDFTYTTTLTWYHPLSSNTYGPLPAGAEFDGASQVKIFPFLRTENGQVKSQKQCVVK